MKQNRQRSWRQGFTLVETLAAVAIVVILLAVSAVGVAYYARWLKITELDNAAREIYLAAENRAVLLSSSSRLEHLVQDRGTSMTVTLSSGPDGTQTAPGYYIYHSGGREVADLLPLGTIDPALLEGRFYIVYEPEGGSVTDVFYAEDGLDSVDDFQAFYEDVSTSARSKRMRMKPMVGYYGGGTAENAKDNALGVPIVTIKNEETLTAEITYAVFPSMADKVQLDVTLIYDGISISLENGNTVREEKDGRVRFTHTVLLDSLEPGKHFYNLFQYEPSAPSSYGGDFTVTATLTAEGATPSSGSDTDNSLFAEGSGGETACIANLRHLQNLNAETSRVDGKNEAVQTADIDCSAYLEEEYTFTPIRNDRLESFDGTEHIIRNLSAEAEGNAGLFASVDGMEFQNIRLVNAFVEGTDNAGALVGSAKDAAFDNCWVYWEPEAGAAGLRDVLGDNETGYNYQMIGKNAGGLAGQLDGGTVENCLAATLVQGTTVTGGLVGQANGTVEITGSYADCYLAGERAGGLVGTAEELELQSCYAAGFIEITDDKEVDSAAGLCTSGTVHGESVYSVMRCSDTEKNWEPLAPNMTGTDCYYLSSAMSSETDERAKTYTEMISANFATTMGDAFGDKGQDSHPYNLRTDLALTVYDFPGLPALPHYGDWSAQFAEASLVYYEQYGENAYGFYGGGVDALQNGEPIKDGYAIAIRQEGSAQGSLTAVTINGKSCTLGSLFTVTGADGTVYSLAPLPEELVNSTDTSEDFYQALSFMIDNETYHYYYCPHFAKTAVKTDEIPQAPTGVSVRTPRHLYMLSLYPAYYSGRYTFHQELDLDYATYTGYALFPAGFTQVPIGRFDEPFNGFYDGGCHAIKNLVFKPLANTTRAYAGLFGYSTGTLRDIVYLMDAGKQNTVSLGSHNNLYIGGLAGGNAGSIVNCAAAGVNLTGNAYTATIYIGGLVGLNQGEITNCGAECAALAADTSSYASAYVGGLVGLNQSSGIITSSYAVGRASAEADTTSRARVCGFVGYNQGLVRDSYAAMDLSSSGKAVEIYGFCGVTDGTQSGTFFLNTGNFTYRDSSYNASYTPRKAKAVKYDVLTDRTNGGPVAGMSYVAGSGFPYPTAVKDAAGKPVHYGLWPEQMQLGIMGVYYWEKLEIKGETPTCHVSLMAVDSDGETIARQTTLSTAHSDNGVVTDYGYGYYYADLDNSQVSVVLTANNINYSQSGKAGSVFSAKNAEEAVTVNNELARLMPGYAFHSYRSFGMEEDGGGLYPTGSPNGTFTLTRTVGNTTDAEAAFAVNPHFAAALAVTKYPSGWKLTGGASTAAPGSTAGNPYQVRAVSQLQNINWNSTKCNTNTVLTSSNQPQFPYLSYISGSSQYVRQYCWTQTHDLKGEEGKTYTPIAEYYDNTADATGAFTGWFGGSYHGQDYLIEDVSIQGGQSGPSSVSGLFGVVYNGSLSHIIMYSSDGSGRISGSFDTTTTRVWTAIGGLAGVVASSGQSSGVDSCSVAGYTIEANFKSFKAAADAGAGNWGGAEIGGLVGFTNCNLTGCSAETDIVFQKINSNDNVRVGGLVGSAIGTIQNCYAGGSISFAETTDIKFSAGAIYIGGLVGGAYFKPMQVGNVTIGPELAAAGDAKGHSEKWNSNITNCYSYVELPALRANNNIKALYTLGGVGELNPPTTSTNRTYDGKQDHGTCTITNSYYLGTEVLKNNTSDVLVGEAKKGPTTSTPNPIVYPFRTDVNASGVTALNYAQLAGKDLINGRSIYSLLTAFTPVTSKTDDGFSIAGKYSYPSAANLQGLNYPFPTILTRESGRYHVHYGNWPLNGIKRAAGGAPIELDLFTNPEHTEKLELEGVGTGGAWSVESQNEAVATAVCQNGSLTVTGTGVGVTTLTVAYTEKGGESCALSLSVNVTAVLELRTADSPVRLFTNDTAGIQLTAYGKGGQQLQEMPGLTIAASVGVYDGELLKEAGADGNLTLNLATGDTEGSATVNLNYTYTYNDVDYTGVSAITFQITEPEIETDKDGSTRLIRFDGGQITAAEVTDVSLGEGTPPLEPDGDTVKLDMRDVPPGEAVTVEVVLTMDGRMHKVTVTVTAEEQVQEPDEPGGEGQSG